MKDDVALHVTYLKFDKFDGTLFSWSLSDLSLQFLVSLAMFSGVCVLWSFLLPGTDPASLPPLAYESCVCDVLILMLADLAAYDRHSLIARISAISAAATITQGKRKRSPDRPFIRRGFIGAAIKGQMAKACLWNLLNQPGRK